MSIQERYSLIFSKTLVVVNDVNNFVMDGDDQLIVIQLIDDIIVIQWQNPIMYWSSLECPLDVISINVTILKTFLQC